MGQQMMRQEGEVRRDLEDKGPYFQRDGEVEGQGSRLGRERIEKLAKVSFGTVVSKREGHPRRKTSTERSGDGRVVAGGSRFLLGGI